MSIRILETVAVHEAEIDRFLVHAFAGVARFAGAATATRAALRALDMFARGEFLVARVTANAGNGDFQRRWLQSYLALAASADAQRRLAGLLDGTVKVDGLVVNQDVRWDIIEQLNRRDYPGSAALVTAEATRDNSAAGQAAAIAAEAARPDAATKAH